MFGLDHEGEPKKGALKIPRGSTTPTYRCSLIAENGQLVYNRQRKREGEQNLSFECFVLQHVRPSSNKNARMCIDHRGNEVDHRYFYSFYIPPPHPILLSTIHAPRVRLFFWGQEFWLLNSNTRPPPPPLRSQAQPADTTTCLYFRG